MALLDNRRQLRAQLHAADGDLLATLQLVLTMVAHRARPRRRSAWEDKQRRLVAELRGHW